jgi:hypothetical protein
MMSMAVIVTILIIGGAGLFALGFLVGRRSRAMQRGFDVVAVHDEKQH